MQSDGRGLSYVKSYRSVQNEAGQQKKQLFLDREAVDTQLEQLETVLKEGDKTHSFNNVDDEREYLYKDKYAQESVFMQLDPVECRTRNLVGDSGGRRRSGTTTGEQSIKMCLIMLKLRTG